MPGDWVRISALVPERKATTIPNGQSLSAVVELDGQFMASVRVPPSAGWTAANLTFMGSMDGGMTYGDVWKDGAEYAVTVGAGRTNATVFLVEARDFLCFTHIRVRSGTAALPVNQGGARELQIGRMP